VRAGRSEPHGELDGAGPLRRAAAHEDHRVDERAATHREL